MNRITIVALAVLALALSACGDTSTDTSGGESAASGEAEALKERIAELEAEDKREERAAERAAEDRREERRERRERRRKEREQRAASQPEPDPAPSEQAGSIIVPDVAGLDHQAAQDALQGEGLWLLDEKDATGQGRLLLWDRNWEVVRTDPPAGTAVSKDTVITILSKKQGE